MTAFFSPIRTLSVSRELHRIATHQVWTQQTRVVKLKWGRKILEFYKAPVTKFWSNVVRSFFPSVIEKKHPLTLRAYTFKSGAFIHLSNLSHRF